MTGGLAGLASATVLVLAAAVPAQAGTIVVNTTLDEVAAGGTCSLREAVTTANNDANSGGCVDQNAARPDVIKLSGGDYKLSIPGTDDANANGDLDISDDLTITGLGSANTGIDGNGSTTGDRALEALGSGTSLRLSGLTVDHGTTTGNGGGIDANQGTVLTLTNSSVEQNSADPTSAKGGGIEADRVNLVGSSVVDNGANSGAGIDASTANLTRTSVSRNSADGFAGGIQADTANLTSSSVSGNSAGKAGGGIDASTVHLTASSVTGNTALANGFPGIGGGGVAAVLVDIDRTRVTGNAAANGPGGGVSADDGTIDRSTIARNSSAQTGGGLYMEASGTLSVANSAVFGNYANAKGGGIYVNAGTVNLTDSTLSANGAQTWGGGIAVDAGVANLRSDTINRNVADADATGNGDGGGIERADPGAINLRNTIVAGNTDRGGQAPDWSCTLNTGITSQGYNLIGSVAGCAVPAGTGDQKGTNASPVNPGLALLAQNGGPTLTSALLPTSPAINTGNPATPGSGGTACPAADQRGVPRALGGRCDKGAYERVLCHGTLVNVVGTSGADSLTGTAGADGVLGLGGNDTVNGGSGNDGLCGGAGNDSLSGAGGNDFLDGGPGTDRCDGGPGTDSAIACETKTGIP